MTMALQNIDPLNWALQPLVAMINDLELNESSITGLIIARELRSLAIAFAGLCLKHYYLSFKGWLS